jgi:hypothetical protein
VNGGGDRLGEVVRLPIELCDWNAPLDTEGRVVRAVSEKVVELCVGRPATQHYHEGV